MHECTKGNFPVQIVTCTLYICKYMYVKVQVSEYMYTVSTVFNPHAQRRQYNYVLTLNAKTTVISMST